ncbi:MAG TPA: hypothetical protein VGH23_21765 [Rhizomicrobium sp.]|jgi:hypothetical protein
MASDAEITGMARLWTLLSQMVDDIFVKFFTARRLSQMTMRRRNLVDKLFWD